MLPSCLKSLLSATHQSPALVPLLPLLQTASQNPQVMLLSLGMAALVKFFPLILFRSNSLVYCQVANRIHLDLRASWALLVCVCRNSTLPCGTSLLQSPITASLQLLVLMSWTPILLFQQLKSSRTSKTTASTIRVQSTCFLVTSLLREPARTFSLLQHTIILRRIFKPPDRALILRQWVLSMKSWNRHHWENHTLVDSVTIKLSLTQSL